MEGASAGTAVGALLPAWHCPPGPAAVKAGAPAGWPSASLDSGRSRLVWLVIGSRPQTKQEGEGHAVLARSV